jgi:hypothetical protein
MQVVFSRKAFEKSANIKFYENPSSSSRAVAWGRTDIHDEANSRLAQFCEKAFYSQSHEQVLPNDTQNLLLKHYAHPRS